MFDKNVLCFFLKFLSYDSDDRLLEICTSGKGISIMFNNTRLCAKSLRRCCSFELPNSLSRISFVVMEAQDLPLSFDAEFSS